MVSQTRIVYCKYEIPLQVFITVIMIMWSLNLRIPMAAYEHKFTYEPANNISTRSNKTKVSKAELS